MIFVLALALAIDCRLLDAVDEQYRVCTFRKVDTVVLSRVLG